VVFIINKKNYKIIYKLVSKLATKILITNVFLDYKLVFKRLIETNLEYKIVSS